MRNHNFFARLSLRLTIAALAALVTTLSVFAAPQDSDALQVAENPPVAAPVNGAILRMEQAVVAQINVQRMRQNLPALRQNPALTRAARLHSRNMAQRNFFSHADPQTRTDVGERTRTERYNWQSVGENIAMNGGYKDPVPVAVQGWMKSPGHRENILRPNYTETGVGIAKIGSKYYLTQVFGRPFTR